MFVRRTMNKRNKEREGSLSSSFSFHFSGSLSYCIFIIRNPNANFQESEQNIWILKLRSVTLTQCSHFPARITQCSHFPATRKSKLIGEPLLTHSDVGSNFLSQQQNQSIVFLLLLTSKTCGFLCG